MLHALSKLSLLLAYLACLHDVHRGAPDRSYMTLLVAFATPEDLSAPVAITVAHEAQRSCSALTSVVTPVTSADLPAANLLLPAAGLARLRDAQRGAPSRSLKTLLVALATSANLPAAELLLPAVGLTLLVADATPVDLLATDCGPEH